MRSSSERLLGHYRIGLDELEGNESYFLWGCLLFGAAMVLLVIELFVPSGGLIGILCGVAAIGSIVSFLVRTTDRSMAFSSSLTLPGQG